MVIQHQNISENSVEAESLLAIVDNYDRNTEVSILARLRLYPYFSCDKNYIGLQTRLSGFH